MSDIEKCFDSYLTNDAKRLIQHHKDQIKYSKECLKKLERQQLKEKSVDFSDLCAVRAIMDAAKVPPKRRGE